MATESPAGAGGQPGAAGESGSKQCELRQLYLKDLSFESPHVPGILFGHDKPETSVSVSTSYKLSVERTGSLGDVYEVMLHITVGATSGDRTLFLVELHQGGMFEVTGYAPEDLDRLLRIRAPEMLYPYARELVASLVGRGGFPRMTMRAFNFEKLYAEAVGPA
jgi:preprotein translocase subunit SecB